MKPSLSLILFTTTSGAGFGLFMMLVLTASLAPGSEPTPAGILVPGVLSLILVAAGLLFSTLHLANPRNAIKAFNRFRSSWLSREGVFSLLFFPLAIAYLAGAWVTGEPGQAWVRGLGWLGVAIALATVFSTGMIYASLKTIRQWHNPLVPASYILIGLATGGILLTAIRALGTGADYGLLLPATLGLIAVAAFIKLVYYFWIGRPEGPTINTATNVTGSSVRLLDVGHSHGTFLTDEFGHAIGPRASAVLRSAALALAFAVPFLALVALAGGAGAAPMSLLALAAAAAGVLLERWLFLVEGQHVVNLYHGRQRT